MHHDEQQLQQLKAGKAEAYQSLVDEYEGRLFRFFFCHHRDYHLAEEQLSETFAQLVRSLPKMKGPAGSLPAFVFAVARHVRSRTWKKTCERHSSLETAAHTSDAKPNAAVQAESREKLQLVLDAISAMTPVRRDVFLLRFVEGYSVDDISKSLKIPDGSVKSHIHRGRAELRGILAKSGYGHEQS